MQNYKITENIQTSTANITSISQHYCYGCGAFFQNVHIIVEEWQWFNLWLNGSFNGVKVGVLHPVKQPGWCQSNYYKSDNQTLSCVIAL